MFLDYEPTIPEFINSRSWPAPVTRDDVLRVARELGVKLRNGRVPISYGYPVLSYPVEADARLRARIEREATHA